MPGLGIGGEVISRKEVMLRMNRGAEYDEQVDGPISGGPFRPSAKHAHFDLPIPNAKVSPFFDKGRVQLSDGSEPAPRGPKYRPSRQSKHPLPKLEPLPPLFRQAFTPVPQRRHCQMYGLEMVNSEQSPWWALKPGLELQPPARPGHGPGHEVPGRLPYHAPQTAFPGMRLPEKTLDSRLMLLESRETPEFRQEMRMMRMRLNSAREKTCTPRLPSGAGALLRGLN